MMPPLDAITRRSFAIIDEELAGRGEARSPGEDALLRRAIHTTADFSLVDTLRFHPMAVEVGLAGLRRAGTIVADVQMVAIGIDRRRLGVLGSICVCGVADPRVSELAAAEGLTRSAAGIRLALAGADQGSIVVIGNAPTALREVLRLVEQEKTRPALIIGVPVGFVDAAESKAALIAQDAVPWIAVAGRRGGSAVAVALANGLLHLLLPPGEGYGDATA